MDGIYTCQGSAPDEDEFRAERQRFQYVNLARVRSEIDDYASITAEEVADGIKAREREEIALAGAGDGA